MPTRQCPQCAAQLPGVYARALHLATFHHCYEDGQYVEGKTMRQLEKVGARVLELLIHRPETRNPKNWPLWSQYIQRYSKGHILVYDVGMKGWMINRPGGVLRPDDLRCLFAELETARRRRQDLQHADKLMYHSNTLFMPEHQCILPAAKDAILAEQKQMVMKAHYGRQPDAYEYENTYVPDSEE